MKHYITILKLSFSALVLLAIFSSCTQKHSAEIAKIDSLQTSLNIVEQRLYELDSNHVFKIYDKYTDTWARLNEVFPDVRDENWGTLCAFENIKSGIKGYKKRYSNLVKELKHSKLQLDDFKTDLENEKFEITKFDDYYNAEVKAIFDLSLATNATIDNAKQDIVRFDSLAPLMENVIIYYQELQNK